MPSAHTGTVMDVSGSNLNTIAPDGYFTHVTLKRNWKLFFYVANYFVRPVHFSIKYANEQRGGDHDVILRHSARCPDMPWRGHMVTLNQLWTIAQLRCETAWALLSYKLIQVITEGGREYKVIFKFAPIWVLKLYEIAK